MFKTGSKKGEFNIQDGLIVLLFSVLAVVIEWAVGIVNDPEFPYGWAVPVLVALLTAASQWVQGNRK